MGDGDRTWKAFVESEEEEKVWHSVEQTPPPDTVFFDIEPDKRIYKSFEPFFEPETLSKGHVRDLLESQPWYGPDGKANAYTAIYLADLFGVTEEEAYTMIPRAADAAKSQAGTPLLEVVKNAWNDGNVDFYQGMAGWGLIGEIIVGNQVNVQKIQEEIDYYETFRSGQDPKQLGFLKASVAGTVGTLPLQAHAELRAMPAGTTAGLAAASGFFALGQAGPQALLPEEVVTLPSSFIGGYMVGRKVAKTVVMSQFMTGKFLSALLEKGVDPRAAIAVAIPIGIGMGLIENAQFDQALALFGGKTRGLATFGKKLSTKLFGEGGKLAMLANRMVTTAGTYVQEIVEEDAQEALQIFGEVMTAEMHNYFAGQKEIDTPTIAEAGQRIWQTTTQSAQALWLLMAVPGVTGTGISLLQSTDTRPAALGGDKVDVLTTEEAERERVQLVETPEGLDVIVSGKEDEEARDQRVPLAEASDKRIEAEIRDVETLEEFKAKIREAMPNVTAEQAEAVGVLVEAHARTIRGTADEWLKRRFSPGEAQWGIEETSEHVQQAKNVLRVLSQKDADVSTVIHELGHVWRYDLAGEDYGVIANHLGVENGEWTTEAEEQFAEELTQYLQDGVAPTGLEKVFAKFREWMKHIYGWAQEKHEIPDEVSAVFGRMFEITPPDVEASLRQDADIMGFGDFEEFQRYAQEQFDADELPDSGTLAMIWEAGQMPKTVVTQPEAQITPEPEPEASTIEGTLRELAQTYANPMDFVAELPLLLPGEEMPKAKELIAIWDAAHPQGVTAIAPEATLEGQKIEEAVTAEEVEARALAALAEHERETSLSVKTQVRRSTGQTRTSRLVSEEEALRTGIQKSVVAARKAMIEGRREGVAQERQRKAALEQRQRENKASQALVRKQIKEIKVTVKKTKEWDPFYKREVEKLVDGIDLVWRRRSDTLASLEGTAQFLRNAGGEHDLPADIHDKLAILDKTPFSEMTADDIADLHKAIGAAAKLNQLKKSLRDRSQQRDFNETKNFMVKELPPPGKHRQRFYGNKELGRVERALDKVENFVGVEQEHYDAIVERVFGEGSVGNQVLGRNVEGAITGRLGYQQNVFDTFRQDLANMGFKGRDTAAWLSHRVKVPGLELARRVRLERGQRIAIYMHAQDPDNLKSIVGGGVGFKHGPEPDTAYNIRPDEVAAIVNSMSEEELMFAEAAKNLFRRQGEALAKKFLELNGWDPVMRENYYRKEVMPITRKGAADSETEDYLDGLKQQHFRVGVPKGFMIERQGSSKPIYLNNIVSDINRSVLDSSAYLHLEEPLRNAHYLLTDPELKDAIVKRVGNKTYQAMSQALRDIGGEHRAYEELEGSLQWLRSGVTKYALGMNLWVAGKQALSVPFASMYINPKYLGKGVMEELFRPKKTRAWHEQLAADDPRYRERKEAGHSRDIAEVGRKGIAAKNVLKARPKLGELLMKPTRAVDLKSVSAIMQGAMRQVDAELKSGKVSKAVKDALHLPEKLIQQLQNGEAMTDPVVRAKLGYEFGRYVVARTQPMFSPEYMSNMQRGSEYGKLLTQFSSFTNQEFNMLRRAIRDARHGDWRKMVMFAVGFTTNVAGVFALDYARDVFRAALKGKEPDEEDMRSLASTAVDSVFGMVYGVRDVQKAVTRYAKRGGQPAVDLPVLRVVNTLVEAGGSLNIAMDPGSDPNSRRRAWGRFFDASIDLFMMSVGIPYVIKRGVEAGLERRGVKR